MSTLRTTMLFLIVIHSFLARNANSAPILSAVDQSTEPPSNDSEIYRTTAGIVWNCLITIFLCTWVAIHPNVPAPTEGWLSISLLRFKTMIYALLAPELMMWWAARQWLGAEQLANTNEFRGTLDVFQTSLVFKCNFGSISARLDENTRILRSDGWLHAI